MFPDKIPSSGSISFEMAESPSVPLNLQQSYHPEHRGKMREAGHGGSELRGKTLHIAGNTRSVVESENVKNRLGVGKRLAFKKVPKGKRVAICQ